MIQDIKVPSLGESVTEATLTKWYKKVGDYVKVDEILAELETDKVTLEVPSPCSGTLKKISIESGKTVEIGWILGQIEVGEQKSTPSDKSVNEIVQTAKDDKKAESKSQDQQVSKASDKSGIPSPSATKVIEEHNLKSEDIKGTGKDNRITKNDAMLAANTLNTKVVSTGTVKEIQSSEENRVPMSKLRQTIARRLKDSQNTAAILTTFNEVDMNNVMTLRSKYQEDFHKKYGIKLGFMSFFVKAVTMALAEMPIVNASIDGDDIVYKSSYNIGVAVGTPSGLVVPVLRNADKMSLVEIEESIAALAKKARDNKLSVDEMTGGTFSITNGGIYGSLLSTPIINPPQSAILGMHNIVQRPVVVNNEIVIRPMMYLALSYDHRLIDGSGAVTFLVKVKNYVEAPERMLINV